MLRSGNLCAPSIKRVSIEIQERLATDRGERKKGTERERERQTERKRERESERQAEKNLKLISRWREKTFFVA